MAIINYLDRILHLYPDVQNVMVWHQKTTQLGFKPEEDGTPWENPYDGIVWESKVHPKPDQKTLDAIPDADIQKSMEVRRKKVRDASALNDMDMVANLVNYQVANPSATMTTYLDMLEAKQAALKANSSVV